MLVTAKFELLVSSSANPTISTALLPEPTVWDQETDAALVAVFELALSNAMAAEAVEALQAARTPLRQSNPVFNQRSGVCCIFMGLWV